MGCSMPSTIFTRSYTKWFTSCFSQKDFSQDQVKTFVVNFLNSKLAEFYLRRINKLPDKWQDVIQNNGEYTIG